MSEVTRILYDLFPAHLSVAPPSYTGPIKARSASPDYYYVDATRVIITNTNITVAADSPTGPQIIFNERYTSFTKSATPTEDSFVTTESGKRLAFSKDTNCGCGSRLRSWNPYKTLNSIKDIY